MPDPDIYAVRDLEQYAGPADAALFAKARADVAKARDWQPEEPDFPQVVRSPGDWFNVPAALYERHRRGEITFSQVCKAMSEDVYVSPAEVGQAWLDSLNDPRQAAKANEDYERGRRGLADDELDR